MKGQQQLGVKGGYSLRVFKEDGAEVKEKHIPFVQNAVTNDGIEAQIIGSSNNLFGNLARAVVGTGTNLISQTSTGLGSRFKASSDSMRPAFSDDLTHTDNGDGTVTSQGTFKISFAIGDFSGDSFSEVGLEDRNGSNLWAGQLIKDQNGDPTTITILNDEQLVVEYVIEVTSWFTRQELDNISVTVNGVTTTARLFVNPFIRDSSLANGSAQTVTSETNAGNASFFDSTSTNITGDVFFTGGSWSYSSGVSTLTVSETFSPSSFNSTDIKYFQVGYVFISLDLTSLFAQAAFGFLLEFDTPVEKTSSQAMTIDFSVDLTVTQ